MEWGDTLHILFILIHQILTANSFTLTYPKKLMNKKSMFISQYISYVLLDW